MTTVVYKNGTLATDTKLVLNQENLDASGDIISGLLDNPETDEVDRGILLRSLDFIKGGVMNLHQDGKFIVLDKEQQFYLHEDDIDNEVVAIAGVGNMLAFADIKNWIDGATESLDEFWYRYNTRMIRDAENGTITYEEAFGALVELMFITKKGCYTWGINSGKENCRDECYYPNDDQLAIIMGSGAQRFTDEIIYRISVAEVACKQTPEELVRIAMEHDELTGGEVKTFIYH